MKSSHKLAFTKKERIQQSSNLMSKNKDTIPIICEKDSNCKLKKLIKTKYLIKRETILANFSKIIREKLEIESYNALFFLANCNNEKHPLDLNKTFGEIYDKYKDEDGFLYLIYSNEEVWG